MNDFTKREIVITEDGSYTFYVPELEEHFHSIYGAIQESNHVFIQNGLFKCKKQKLVVLETGFGTGLNVLLTLINKGEREIRYFSLEKYPLTANEYNRLNYPDLIPGNTQDLFLTIHQCEWNKEAEIVPGFLLTKLQADLTDFSFKSFPCFDLIYFDAFAPGKQPEMWAEPVFSKIAEHTSPKGIFVTYCAQGEVRRTLNQGRIFNATDSGTTRKKRDVIGREIGFMSFSLKNSLSS
ncbi:MAG: tRNA (5-methylaminomethyl-2-thiouridine)(34)-methyltransferase MnmD [Mangrovibacterium sp.]